MPKTAQKTRVALRELLAGRIKAAEDLAAQLGRFEQASADGDAAVQGKDHEAERARELYNDAVEAGWSAAELGSAGLQPHTARRTRTPDVSPASND